jgi:hypothetical protein
MMNLESIEPKVGMLVYCAEQHLPIPVHRLRGLYHDDAPETFFGCYFGGWPKPDVCAGHVITAVRIRDSRVTFSGQHDTGTWDSFFFRVDDIPPGVQRERHIVREATDG